MGEKQEVKGARVYPPAERNHLYCAPAAWDHISALVFVHLFSKNNTYLSEDTNEAGVRSYWQMRIHAPHGLACLCYQEVTTWHTQMQTGRGCFWMIHQWKLLDCAPDRRIDMGDTNRWITQALWKDHERAVLSHPSILVKPSAHPAVLQPDTHILIFTFDSHTCVIAAQLAAHPCSPSCCIFQLDTSCWHFHRH